MLTASGGPFRGRAADELADVTVEQALAHPTWDMGPVVTINSATLVNKGLELIEAHLLFDVPYADIDVVVHPQSIVHSMVTFADGATIAQASPPDMRLPIALALAWPDRLPGRAAGAGLVDRQHLGVRAAGRGRLPGGAAGPAGRARPAASSRRCSTPPTRRRSPRSWRVACRSGASSTSSRVPSTTRRTSAHPPASRTCWPRRSGPGSTPGAPSPEAEAERDPSHDPRDRRLRASACCSRSASTSSATSSGPAGSACGCRSSWSASGRRCSPGGAARPSTASRPSRWAATSASSA